VEWVAGRILTPPAGGTGRGVGLTADERSAIERGATAYAESCFACHGEDGRGAPQPGGTGLRAPALAGSPCVLGHRDYVINAVLHGLTGPIDGRTFAEVMPPMTASKDAWIADIASYIRNSFGNSASVVTEADVARVRRRTSGRTAPWSQSELTRVLPRPLIPDATWRAAASHNPETASGAFDLTRWSTGVPQQPGMWFQVELPRDAVLTEIQFDSAVGGGGRGGAPPAVTSPRAYRVEVSIDGKEWSGPVAEGEGAGRTTTIAFAPVKARFVRITQTAQTDDAPAWTIERLRVYEEPPAEAGAPK
jgi:mono/diheme cytochrome c family protein